MHSRSLGIYGFFSSIYLKCEFFYLFLRFIHSIICGFRYIDKNIFPIDNFTMIFVYGDELFLYMPKRLLYMMEMQENEVFSMWKLGIDN